MGEEKWKWEEELFERENMEQQGHFSESRLNDKETEKGKQAKI